MKITPKLIAYISLLIYWSPSNSLSYIWSFILLGFILFFKPNWLKPTSPYHRGILICTIIFFVTFIISLLTNFFFQNTSLNNALWCFITYGSSFAALLVFFNIPYNAHDYKYIFRFSIVLTVFEIALGYFQMISASSFQSLNPFVLSAAAGDYFVGSIFDIGIGNEVAIKISIIALGFIPFWFSRKNLKNSLLLLLLTIGWILPSAIYTLLCGLVVVLYFYVFKRALISLVTFRLNLSIFVAIIIGLFSTIFFVTLQPNNVSYIKELLTRTYNTIAGETVANPVGKIVYYQETLGSLLKEYPHTFVIGVGPGNYSSRSAWLVSGSYLENQPPYIPVTPSVAAQNFTLKIWTKEFITDAFPDAGSIMYQPFSTWLSVFSEFGLIGLFSLAMIVYLIYKIINLADNQNDDTYLKNLAVGSRLVCSYIVLLFFIDNLFEWPIVMAQFFILIGSLNYDRKQFQQK